MQLISKIKQAITKKQFIFIILFSLMITFNGFIFNQFDVMYKNQAEFSVLVSEIAWFFILMAVIIWMLLSLILILLLYKSNKLFVNTTAILMGLALASYIQVLFMNKPHLMTVAGNMSLRETPLQFAVNALIFLAIVFIPLVLVIVERKKGKVFTPKLALLLSIVILAMQLVGVFSSAAAADSPTKNNELFYFSSTQQLQLSQKENVLVFVMDRLDTENTDKVFETYSDATDIFDGFTYYKNNISKYPGTFPGVTDLLTDKHFDKDTASQKEYLSSAWEDPALFSALKQQEYEINTLIDSASTFSDYSDLIGKINNISEVKPKNRHINPWKYYVAMQSFALVRQSFDLSKIIFRISSYVDIPNYCIDIKNTPDYFPRTISPHSDLDFFEALNKEDGGLYTQSNTNTFSFVHLHSSHAPYLYDKDLNANKNINKNSGKLMAGQTYGSFKILEEYFSQMKKLGIYDDSTIIVLGDHGNWNDLNPTKNPPTTSLFVKLSDNSAQRLNVEKNGSGLKIDTETQLSHDNFNASLLDIIGKSELKGDKKSYFDIIKNGGVQKDRQFYYIRWTNLNSFTYIGSYTVNGDANLSDSWKAND